MKYKGGPYNSKIFYNENGKARELVNDIRSQQYEAELTYEGTRYGQSVVTVEWWGPKELGYPELFKQNKNLTDIKEDINHTLTGDETFEVKDYDLEYTGGGISVAFGVYTNGLGFSIGDWDIIIYDDDARKQFEVDDYAAWEDEHNISVSDDYMGFGDESPIFQSTLKQVFEKELERHPNTSPEVVADDADIFYNNENIIGEFLKGRRPGKARAKVESIINKSNKLREDLNNDLDIWPIGPARVDYTGGGIYVAYMPVEINGTSENEEGEELELAYDSESLFYDNDQGEFSIVYSDKRNWDEEPATEFGDNGVLVFEKNSPYTKFYKRLRRALINELKKDRFYSNLLKEKGVNESLRNLKEGVTVYDGSRKALDLYLNWEGIIGYTQDILDTYYDIYPYDKEALDEYLKEEGIIGYTDDIVDILETGEAYLRDADEEDVKDLRRRLGIDESMKKGMRRNLRESTEVIDRKGFATLVKYSDPVFANASHGVLSDGAFVYKFWAHNDEEAKKIFQKLGTRGRPEVDDQGWAIVSEMLEESKQLNEGPGAGYKISGTLDTFTINSFDVKVDGETDFGKYYTINCDIDGVLSDVRSEGYYTRGVIDETPIKITEMLVSSYKDYEGGEPTEEDIYDLLTKFDFEEVYGGGWSHSTFANDLEIDANHMNYGYSEFDLDKIVFKFTDPQTVDAIDKYSTGDNYTTEFSVLDEDDYEVEFFDDKEAAIKFAEENDLSKVVETHWYWEYLGNGEYNTTDRFEDNDVVWEAE